MKKKSPTRPAKEGARHYQQWREKFLSNPETRVIYEEEAAQSALWLQLVEARNAAGLTQQERKLIYLMNPNLELIFEKGDAAIFKVKNNSET